MSVRSLLYVPADNDRFISKAHLRGADAIILDLEDSVTPEKKMAAQRNLGKSVASVGQLGAKVFVRINSGIDAAKEDALAASNAGAQALYVSKANVQLLRELDGFLGKQESKSGLGPIEFIPLIEDASALLSVSQIACQNRVTALTVGGEDLANELGAMPDPDVLKLPKQMVHFAAKSNGLASYGTFRSVANYTDLDAIEIAALEAKRYGFDGASCVHPQVVPVLNTAFSPTDAELLWADEILEIFNQTGAGSFSHRGRMIDAPVLERARILKKLSRANLR